MFTDAVTIYNHHRDKWYRTVIDGVQWNEKDVKTVDGDGRITISSRVSITIHYQEGFVEPEKYAGVGFTFGLENLDIVVPGDCPAEITDDYTITDLKNDYPGAATIAEFKDNTRRSLLKHWRVYAT